ncbi:MAG: GspE/PulE family protein, partial [Bacteroidota bacterium]
LLSQLSAQQAHQLRVIPIAQEDGAWTVLGEKDRQSIIPNLQMILGGKVILQNCEHTQLEKLLHQYYPQSVGDKRSAKPQAQTLDESEAVQLVDKCLQEAAAMGASDLHFECYQQEARVRYRWEGQMLEKYQIPLTNYKAVVSRIKILAELDISERRLPQDGRIHLARPEGDIDIRVSTMPAKFGEKCVLRLLSRSAKQLDLQQLNWTTAERKAYHQAIQRPNGLVLITGPTGSGKTTTLYASLHHLNQPNRNLVTIEDPIEYNLAGINQVQLKAEIGLDFERALRAFLRQDPDIIMVGEIRDGPTAQIAIRAALTGHLVFSTLHTNSAWDAVVRLSDMGVAPYLLAASLRMVVAQRLVRKLCPHCKRPTQKIIAPAWQKKHQVITHHEAVGCEHCYYTGFRGREAVFEMLPIGPEVQQAIKEGQALPDQYQQRQKLRSLSDNLLKLVHNGISTINEVRMHMTE